MTTQETPRPTEPRRRFQFTLRGMMVFVLGVAVGLGWGKMQGWSGDAILAAAAFWMVLGLASQVRDLRTTFHGRPDLPSEERWGWRFAVFWRVGLASLLAGYYLVKFLQIEEFIHLPSHPGLGAVMAGHLLPDALFYLSLLIVLGSGIPRKPKKRESAWPSVCDVLAVCAGAVWCVLLCSQDKTMHFVTALSLHAIERAQPAGLLDDGVDPDIIARTQRFLWQAAFGASLFLLNVGLTRQMAHHWRHGLRRRALWAGLLILSLAFTACYVTWISTNALPAAFPLMIEAQIMGPLHLWILAALLLTLLVTVGAYRMAGATGEPERSSAVNWRRHERAYYHERRAVMLLVAGAICWDWGRVVIDGYLENYLYVLPTFPTFYFATAILAVALYGALARRPDLADSHWFDAPRLPIYRFCAIWLALFLTAVLGIPMVGLLSFAVWFGPWYVVSWP